MNLQPVYPPYPRFHVTCIRCGMRVASEHAAADLDSVPFLAYYCAPCAEVRRAERDAADIAQGAIAEVRK